MGVAWRNESISLKGSLIIFSLPDPLYLTACLSSFLCGRILVGFFLFLYDLSFIAMILCALHFQMTTLTATTGPGGHLIMHPHPSHQGEGGHPHLSYSPTVDVHSGGHMGGEPGDPDGGDGSYDEFNTTPNSESDMGGGDSKRKRKNPNQFLCLVLSFGLEKSRNFRK